MKNHVFHAIFVGGTLAKQRRNQEKTVDSATIFDGKCVFFHYNLVGGTLGKLPDDAI